MAAGWLLEIGFKTLNTGARPLYVVVENLTDLIPLVDIIGKDQSVLTKMTVDNHGD